jgi:hypothetical protein
MSKERSKTLKIGLVSDGKFGERAFENIKKKFFVEWILVPEMASNIMLDDEIELDIPECDLYISYARHPDVIIKIAELGKPMILGVLPGVGLLKQIRSINSNVIHAPTMCSLENTTGIPIIDEFTTYFGRPIYEPIINSKGLFEKIQVKRSSLCGSTEAGSKFLLNKKFTKENLQEFALSVCHECRAPRFGHTCDKEVAGFIHLMSLLGALPSELLSGNDHELIKFMEEISKEYERRMNNSRKILNQAI